MHDGVHTDVLYTNRFDENSDLSTTYLGQTKMTRETEIKAVEKIPITGQGYMHCPNLLPIHREYKSEMDNM